MGDVPTCSRPKADRSNLSSFRRPLHGGNIIFASGQTGTIDDGHITEDFFVVTHVRRLAYMGVFFDVPEAFREHSVCPTGPELVRATSETLFEGTNLAGHG